MNRWQDLKESLGLFGAIGCGVVIIFGPMAVILWAIVRTVQHVCN